MSDKEKGKGEVGYRNLSQTNKNSSIDFSKKCYLKINTKM